MSKVSDIRGLLLDCVQDLHSAETEAVRAYPAIIAKITAPALRQAMEDHLTLGREHAARLKQAASMLGETPQGPDCIWARGILDDGRNDTAMVQAGPLLDAALIGAMRKLEQSEIVSYETAIAVARTMGQEDMAQLLEQTHAEELAMDERLHALLASVLSATRP